MGLKSIKESINQYIRLSSTLKLKIMSYYHRTKDVKYIEVYTMYIHNTKAHVSVHDQHLVQWYHSNYILDQMLGTVL